MTIREITKQVAGSEDLLVGEGSVTQLRNGTNYTITKVGAASLPYDDTGVGGSGGSVKDHLISTLAKLNSLQAFDIGYTATGTGAVARTIKSKLDESVSVVDFGAVGDGTTDDTAAIQAAINTGSDNIYLPNGDYSITQLSLANNNQTIIISPQATIKPTTWNQSAILVTGDNVTLTGGGIIESPGTWDGTNVAWTYAVVYVTGIFFKADGIQLVNVPKVGFGIREVGDSKITNCTILGNYPAASWTGVETAHFGIAYDPGTLGGNWIVHNNIIKSCVQGAYLGNYGAGTTLQGTTITSNVFEGCHNHGVYIGGGVGQLIDGNNFNKCQIPIAIVGKHAVISNNILYTNTSGGDIDISGLSIREASHCVISGNVIKGDVTSSSVVLHLTNLTSSPGTTDTIDNNIVVDNIIDVVGAGSTAITVGNTALTENCYNNIIQNNLITNEGRQYQGQIAFFMKTGHIGTNNKVKDNTVIIKGDSYGISLSYQRYAELSGNKIIWEYSAAGSVTVGLVKTLGVTDSDFSFNTFVCAASHGTNVTIRVFYGDGTDARNRITKNRMMLDPTLLSSLVHFYNEQTIEKSGNLLSNAVMEGSFTLGVGTASIVVNNANVSDQNVIITPKDAAAGIVMHTLGYYLTFVDETSFQLTTGTGGPAASDANFNYRIV